MALLGSLVVLTGRAEGTGAVPPWAIEIYPPAMALLIAGYGLRFGHRASLVMAGLILAAVLAAAGGRGYVALRRVVAGLDSIAVGLVLFGLAVLTSMAKGGVLPWRIPDRKDQLPQAPD
jgi:hypothetical protein